MADLGNLGYTRLVTCQGGPCDGMSTAIGPEMPEFARLAGVELELVLRDTDGSSHLYVVEGDRAEYRGLECPAEP